MKKDVSISLSLLVSLLAVFFGISSLLPLYDSQPWTLNNDHLIPFDHLRLLFDPQSIGLFDLVIARIPSVFPDYLIAALTSPASADWNTRLSLYWHISIVLCVFTMLFVAWRVSRVASKAPVLFVMTCAVSFGALCLLFPSYREIIFYSGFPIYHGGNFFNVAISFAAALALVSLSISGSRAGSTRISRAVLSGVVFLGTFSSRMYVVQFVVPVALTYLLFLSRSKTLPVNILHRSRGLGRLVVFMIMAALLGYLGYNFSIHQCTDVHVTASQHVFVSHVERMNSRGLIVLSCALLSILGLRSLHSSLQYSQPSRSHGYVRLAQAFLTCFFLLSVAGTVTVFYIAAVDEWSGYSRYLITAAYWLPVAIALVFEPALSSLFQRLSIENDGDVASQAPHYFSNAQYPAFRFLVIGMLALVAAYSVNSLFSSVGQRALALKSLHSAPVHWVQTVLGQHGLENSLGYVADPPFESRAFYALSEGTLRSLSISTDGNPLIFPHSREEYLTRDARRNRSLSPSPSDVLLPAWVLASQSNTDRLFQKYGEPVSVLGCDQENACLYQFDSSKIARSVSGFLSTWKLDQYRCIDNNGFLGSSLSRLKKSLGI